MSVDVLTFGCRLNAFESEVIRREADNAGLSDTIVINTWSSRSRHSIASSPPGSVTLTMRLARLSLAAATAVAQAAEPQALVRPAPRSQVRIVM